MKLYMIYVGGTCGLSTIELHDVIFASGTCIEDTYKQIEEKWFGDLDGLHIDSYKEVTQVEGYQVSLKPSLEQGQAASSEKLFFVQTGGYQKGVFGELHGYELVVANTMQEAKEKIAQEFYQDFELPHRDAFFEVERSVLIETIGELFVTLTLLPESTTAHPDTIVSDYIPFKKTSES